MGMLLIGFGLAAVFVSRDAASALPMQIVIALVGLGMTAYGVVLELRSDWRY